jgi:hypothetical protein
MLKEMKTKRPRAIGLHMVQQGLWSGAAWQPRKPLQRVVRLRLPAGLEHCNKMTLGKMGMEPQDEIHRSNEPTQQQRRAGHQDKEEELNEEIDEKAMSPSRCAEASDQRAR